MQQTINPPKVPQFWVTHAMDLEQKLRLRMELHVVVKIETKAAKVEAFFGTPPWETSVELLANGMRLWIKARQFSNDDGEAGYDRSLKFLFQALNDDILVTAVDSWYRKQL